MPFSVRIRHRLHRHREAAGWFRKRYQLRHEWEIERATSYRQANRKAIAWSECSRLIANCIIYYNATLLSHLPEGSNPSRESRPSKTGLEPIRKMSWRDFKPEAIAKATHWRVLQVDWHVLLVTPLGRKLS
jgi:hypothetical protein